MKRTIFASLALGLAFSFTVGASLAHAAVHLECDAERGKCPKPPAPPAPPAHPVPPAPPAPPAIDMPELPTSVQAACAGKEDGSRLTMTPRPGETIGGVCEREGDRMVFQLRSYHRAD